MALEIHAYGFICGILGCCIGTLVGRYLIPKQKKPKTTIS